MIWSDEKLLQWIKEGGIENFQHECLNPASIDLRVGSFCRTPEPKDWSALIEIHPDRGITLFQHDFILLSTMEFTRIPNNAVAMLFLKSSTGRKGLEHLHAGYGDPGFCGQWTLEVVNHWPYPVKIYPGQRLFQLVLMDCYPVNKDYSLTGHYQNQRNPTPAINLGRR